MTNKKSNTSEKKEVKKVTKKVNTKEETKKVPKVKEEVTIEVKEKKSKKVFKKIGSFFNNPVPIIIALIIITCLLLFYISRISGKNEILVGEINESEIQVANVHYFTNNSMNYFYADKAVYVGTNDQKIYNYQIGYFVMNDDSELVELASRSGSLDEALDLSQVIKDMSGWNFGEATKSPYFFGSDVNPYLHNLYFVVKASTQKDSDEADIEITYQVDITDIS